jgi:outer membrane lipoprotein LolB
VKRRTSLRAATAAASGLLLALAGCAVSPTSPELSGPRWSGRLALQIEGHPEGSFTASFDLRGSARAGELELFTPLGGTAAWLQWTPDRARLRAPGQPERQAASLNDLLVQATGAPLPVAALFDWLAGVPSVADGWQVDLSGRAEGRLRARRLTAPAADLRIVLHTP